MRVSQALNSFLLGTVSVVGDSDFYFRCLHIVWIVAKVMYYFCNQERIVSQVMKKKRKERQTEAPRSEGFKGLLTIRVVVFSCLAMGGCVQFLAKDKVQRSF